MKTYIYSYRDKKIGFYTKPIYEVMDVEHFTEQIIRSVKAATFDEKKGIKDKALYFLGIFDDITGKYDLLDDAQKLLDLEDYCLEGDFNGTGSQD